MKKLMLTVALLAGSAASAATSQQIEKSKELPQTVVVRRSKADPTDIAVIHSKEQIAAGKKLTNAQFEKMALNAEIKGIAYDSGNELDARSSTSSWSFGVYHRPHYRPYYRSYYQPYNYYPTYSYYGYSYPYSRYYGYSDSYYDYSYYCWYY